MKPGLKERIKLVRVKWGWDGRVGNLVMRIKSV